MARRKPAQRHGVLAIDKPAGMTSRTLVNQVGRWFGEKRCGHAGTLDPDATGVLVVCFGEATAAVRWLTAAPKRYVTTLRFGHETTTDDAAGEPTRAAERPDLRDPRVLAALEVAIAEGAGGIVQQRPPDVSALKRDGVRDHERVRRGETIEREARPVTLHATELLAVDAEAGELRVALEVGSGFYVRAWCRDLGVRLGSAAHMRTLRRTHCGGFVTADASAGDAFSGAALTPDAIEAIAPDDRPARLEPLDRALGRVLPTLALAGLEDAEALERALRCGQRPVVPARWLADARPAPLADVDDAWLTLDRAGVALAVVEANSPGDEWEPSGVSPDLRPTEEDGRKLRVLRGFPRNEAHVAATDLP
ncbi:MAG: hypothetical protein RIT45_2179 [Pseudomonadota bacterium]|jgi:tRNA pseudouridine55 synthase